MSLSSRLASLMESRGISQSALAREVGVSQQTIGKLVRGEARNSVHLHRIAKILGTSVEYLTGETNEILSVSDKRQSYAGPPIAVSDTVEVPEIDLRYGLGSSYLDSAIETETRQFSRGWLRHFTDSPPAELFWARGQGNSMAPDIGDGDIVLIDRSDQTPKMADLIWAFAFGEVGMIKWLRPMPDGSVKIISSNPSVPADVAHDDELHIIGRVVAVVKKV